MRRTQTLLVFLMVGWFCLAAAPSTENDDAGRIIQEALKPSPMESNLRHLTDEIGGRVPGTPAMQRAVEWGIEGLKTAGADTVHTEQFTMPHSWSEGATEMAVSATGTALDPKLMQIPKVEFRVRAVSIAMAPGLAPAKHIPVVDVGEGTSADLKRAGDISGKLVLVHSVVLKTWDDLFAEYTKAPPAIDAAAKGKAKAVAFIATRENDILYRHTNAVAGELERLPMVLVAREDGERIGRLLTSGHPVWADFKSAGLKPKRSIRFILFSGEEQGMIGSRAYAKAHRSELDKAAGVIVFDAGTGKTTGFSLGGRKDLLAAGQRLLTPLTQFDATKLTTDMEWGTDHFDFMLEGVPTFVAEQEEANYLVNYHAVSDTYDKVDFPQLKKHVAEAATLSFELANLPERIGPRLTHAQIEQTIDDSHSKEMLKAAGVWDDWVSGKRGRQK